MMLKLRRADILIENGLELDAWADVAVQGANNPNIVRGAPGRIDVSRGIPVLDVPATRVDRSMGDVHPAGNPHFSLDPGHGARSSRRTSSTASLAWRPTAGPTFEKNRQAFLTRLDEAMARWTKRMEPVQGREGRRLPSRLHLLPDAASGSSRSA